MEENGFPTDKEEIKRICERYGIKSYLINSDESIDAYGDVDLTYKNLDKLPLKFNKVGGNFVCSYNKLKTLEGAPKEVDGNFVCFSNVLETLEGGPIEVRGHFICSNNQLTSLEGCPKEVDYFYCNNNVLNTLNGAPKEVRYFSCLGNPIESLNGISIAKKYRLDWTPFEWVSDELKDLLLCGFDFGLTADECLCLSERNPDREGMINNLESEKKKLIGVLSILYELKKIDKDGRE